MVKAVAKDGVDRVLLARLEREISRTLQKRLTEWLLLFTEATGAPYDFTLPRAARWKQMAERLNRVLDTVDPETANRLTALRMTLQVLEETATLYAEG